MALTGYAVTTACGLDFGTSNTTLGVVGRDGEAKLASLEGSSTTLPSAIFFDFDRPGHSMVGRQAIAAYVEGVDGRFMRALKSVLGTSLIDEETQLNRSRIGFRDVIGRFIAETKRRGEADGAPIEAVVHGRPVHFVDGDPVADARAQAALEDIAHSVGFRHVSFQYEPIAAALGYELERVEAEEIALVADIGGGTSDFSIIRLGPQRWLRPDRADDLLANDGVRVGGTDFDRDLNLASVMPLLGYRSAMKRPGLVTPNHYFTDLASWSKINFLYVPSVMAEIRQVARDAAFPDRLHRLIRVLEQRRGHGLAIAVEAAKIALSDDDLAPIDLSWVEPGLELSIDQQGLVTATQPLADRIADCIQRCLVSAGLPAGRIDAVFLTGGSTLLSHVRSGILATVPQARVVDGDKFTSVGHGLTVEAARRYA